MTGLKRLAAAAAFWMAAAPCLAADPAGDWTGVLHARNGEQTQIGIEVRRGAGGYAVTYEDVTHEARGWPMTATRTGAAPAFRIGFPVGVFTADWDASAGQWRGQWREWSGAYPMELARGAIPPPPPVARGDKITIGVCVALAVLEAAGIARLLQLRRRRRLKALASPA
jgi:hypothetical protein